MNPINLETPCVVIDLDKLEHNIHRFQSYLDEHGIANRPHAKTHKIPDIARMQLKAGAVGITCQKTSEAKVMVDAGINDVFITYNILGREKLERLVAMSKRATLSVSADSAVVVQGLSKAAESAEIKLSVLVECDTGLRRCGVQTPSEATELATLISKSPGLRFAGLVVYPSSVRANAFVRETKTHLKLTGLHAECVSGGGTPQMWQAHTFSDITEHRAGMYILGDRYSVKAGAMTLEDCSMTVQTTIVSHPTPDRAIIDAGSKTLSSDLVGLAGYGTVLEYPGAFISELSEEHGHIDVSSCTKKPEIGERVSLLVNHCCPVVNLMDEVVGVRAGLEVLRWKVEARGTVL
jgi:D-serine deaminase-like pyridoxal phosphate-dependent protein